MSSKKHYNPFDKQGAAADYLASSAILETRR
jgi:hypothetical protein